jgi:hypothetical protein
MDSTEEKAWLEAETARIIREQPPYPPGTSDEVLGHAYRLAQAQALINLYLPEARRKQGKSGDSSPDEG